MLPVLDSRIWLFHHSFRVGPISLPDDLLILEVEGRRICFRHGRPSPYPIPGRFRKMTRKRVVNDGEIQQK